MLDAWGWLHLLARSLPDGLVGDDQHIFQLGGSKDLTPLLFDINMYERFLDNLRPTLKLYFYGEDWSLMVPNSTRYGFRETAALAIHSHAAVLRVPAYMTSEMMGHKTPDSSTEMYVKLPPDARLHTQDKMILDEVAHIPDVILQVDCDPMVPGLIGSGVISHMRLPPLVEPGRSGSVDQIQSKNEAAQEHDSPVAVSSPSPSHSAEVEPPRSPVPPEPRKVQKMGALQRPRRLRLSFRFGI